MMNQIRSLLRRRAPAPPAPATTLTYAPFGRVLYTSGERIFDGSHYRSAFDVELARTLGGQSALDDVTLARAFGVSATAFACAQYRAGVTANLPLHVVTPNGTPLADTPLAAFLTSSAPILYELTLNLLIYGRAYLWKQSNPFGWLTGLRVMNPQQVQEVTGERMRVIGYELRDEFGYLLQRVGLRDIVYVQMYDTRPDGRGLSPFEVAWRDLSLEQGMVIHAAAFFTNSARIDGMLTFETELKDQDYERAKREWQQNFRGANKAHKTAVMPAGATWTPVQAVPKDLAMAELKAEERAAIAAIFGVDLALIGLAEIADPLSANSTYSSKEIAHVRTVALPFLKHQVLPALNRQWAHLDFDRPAYYTLAVNEPAIPQMVEAQLAQAETMTALTDGALVDYDEARVRLGLAQRSGYLVRAPDEVLALFNAGVISLNEARAMLLAQPMPLGTEDIVLMGGQAVPRRRLGEVAHRNADAVGAAGSGLWPPAAPSVPPEMPPTPLPTPPTPTVWPDAGPSVEPGARAGSELWIGLQFANQPDLIALQARLREMLAGQEVAWIDPAGFHATLLYAPAIDDAQRAAFTAALAGLDLSCAGLALRVGSLRAFDSLGEYALHFRIRQSLALRELQQRLYAAAAVVGIQTSAYSVPSAYIPHITMGYSKVKPRPIRFDGRLTIHPLGLHVMIDDEEVLTTEAADGAPPDPPAERSARPLEVTVPLAGHALIESARRMLSAWLTDRGLLDAHWTPAADWRIVLARCDPPPPGALARALRAVDFDRARRIDLQVTGAASQPAGEDRLLLALTLEPSDALSALARSVQEDLRAAGLNAAVPPLQILIGHAVGSLDDRPDIAPFPLVATQVELRQGSAVEQVWTLRGLSGAQAKELLNWEHVVRRKGREASFVCTTLDAVTEVFVRLSLEDSDSDEADIFDAARAMVRAFPTTQAEFISEIEQIIGRAARGESSRAKFGGEMRAALRRFGLVAFRDGMREVGYDPESFGPDELAAFREWQARQSEFVTGIGDEIFREGGLIGGAEQAAARARMWGLVSLESAREAGMAAAAPNQRFLWVMGKTEEHCRDCLRLNGQVHTMREWQASGYTPTSGKTECKSFNCECQLVPTDQPARGEF